MAQINQYVTEAVAIDKDSFLDIDQYISGNYESQKIKWSILQELVSGYNLGNSDLTSTDNIRNFFLNGSTSANQLNVWNNAYSSPLFSFLADGEMDIRGGGYNGINFTRWGVSSYLKQGYDGYRYLRLRGQDRLDLFGGDGGAGLETSMKFENNLIFSVARDFNQVFSYNISDFKFKFELDTVEGYNNLTMNHGGTKNSIIYLGHGSLGATTPPPVLIPTNCFGFLPEEVESDVVPSFITNFGYKIKLYKQTLPATPTVADIVTLLTNLGLV